VDAGSSRASWIPESHNCPGFPQGVSGPDLLVALKQHAAAFDVSVVRGEIIGLEGVRGAFVARDREGHQYNAKMVLLATGIVDTLPEGAWVPEAIHAQSLRLCAICDGYEIEQGPVAAYGPISDAIRHAAFLRTYAREVYAAPWNSQSASDEQIQEAAAAGDTILAGPCTIAFQDKRCVVSNASGDQITFEAVYPVLGSQAQSHLATALGAHTDSNGEITVGADQMTTVSGVYCAGDVVSAVNQIAVATGHAAIAACAIHNALQPNRQ
ncbi:MAG: NAD(P)/FAD-dependent oxidoreductase, partial [Luteimonas sp.]